jgi:hypothetical protein
MTIEDQPSATR